MLVSWRNGWPVLLLPDLSYTGYGLFFPADILLF